MQGTNTGCAATSGVAQTAAQQYLNYKGWCWCRFIQVELWPQQVSKQPAMELVASSLQHLHLCWLTGLLVSFICELLLGAG